MPKDDERIVMSIEAREELSRAVQQMDAALDQFKGSLQTLGGAAKAAEEATDGLDDEVDDIGDEATEASIKLSALHTNLAAFSASDFNLKQEIPIDVDEEDIKRGEVKVTEFRDKVRRALEDAEELEIEGKLDREDIIEELRKADAEIDQHQSEMVVGIDVNEQEATAEVNEATAEIEQAAETIDLEASVSEPSKAITIAEVETLIESAEHIGTIDIDINASDDVVELAALIAQMSKAKTEAFKLAASTRVASGSIDKMGDEAKETAAETTLLASAVSALSLNTTALSLNVGAFNIALANLATQIPILLATIGTLVTAVLGLAGALTLAAGGVSAFIGAGFVAELTRVEEKFDNIEGKAQAMQAIMQSMVDVFMQAIEPLTEMTEATDIFFGAINNTLQTVNLFAKSIADSLQFSGDQMDEFIEAGKNMGLIGERLSDSEAGEQIMSLGEFMDEVSTMFANNASDIMASFEIMAAFLFPIISDMLQFFIAGFDDMIVFVTRFTTELAAMGPLFADLLRFATELINLGSTALQGLLPVFVGLISIATEIASALNQLNPQIIRNVAGFLLLAKVTKSFYDSMMLAQSGISEVIKAMKASQLVKDALMVRQVSLAAGYGTLTASLNAYVFALKGAVSTAWQFVAAQLAKIPVVGGAASSLWKLIGAQISYAVSSAAATMWTWAATTALGGYIGSLWAATVAEYALLSPLLPIIAALGALVAVGALAVGVLGNMDGVTGGLSSTLAGIKAVLTTVGNVLLTVFIGAWNTVARIIEGVMFVVNGLVNALMSLGPINTLVSAMGSGFKALKDAFFGLPSMIRGFFDMVRNGIEDLINMLPDEVKAAVGLGTGEFEFSEAGSGLTVSREDVISGAEDAGSAVGSLTGKQANNFNYNEENVNNVAQEINADPEDKESLRRVVKDAMEEANAFDRRHQGR